MHTDAAENLAFFYPTTQTPDPAINTPSSSPLFLFLASFFSIPVTSSITQNHTYTHCCTCLNPIYSCRCVLLHNQASANDRLLDLVHLNELRTILQGLHLPTLPLPKKSSFKHWQSTHRPHDTKHLLERAEMLRHESFFNELVHISSNMNSANLLGNDLSIGNRTAEHRLESL